ncbi:MAG TPA: GNAT family N-acetyltransferase [Ktedonobacterales bacterium]|nr:GNAT family N-acetyltransferase [Ktedonobacterales bacterium]
MHRLTIQAVTRANWRSALHLRVLPEQQRFVADYEPVAAIALAKAYVGAMGLQWMPYVFSQAEEMVGFVTLAYQAENASLYWVLHFFIDARYQGQGYGKKALEVLLIEIKHQHPACQLIQLTVHPENLAAQRLYSQAGFLPIGEMLEGEPVYQLRLPR